MQVRETVAACEHTCLRGQGGADVFLVLHRCVDSRGDARVYELTCTWGAHTYKHVCSLAGISEGTLRLRKLDFLCTCDPSDLIPLYILYSLVYSLFSIPSSPPPARHPLMSLPCH